MPTEHRNMRQVVVPALKRLHAISVENRVGDSGTPDVNYAEGWIELKEADAWPVRGGPLRLDHYTTEQRLWAKKRAARGGRIWLLLKVGRFEWMLFRGEVAADHLGYEPKEKLIELSVMHWPRGLDREELRDFLVRENEPAGA